MWAWSNPGHSAGQADGSLPRQEVLSACDQDGVDTPTRLSRGHLNALVPRARLSAAEPGAVKSKTRIWGLPSRRQTVSSLCGAPASCERVLNVCTNDRMSAVALDLDLQGSRIARRIVRAHDHVIEWPAFGRALKLDAIRSVLLATRGVQHRRAAREVSGAHLPLEMTPRWTARCGTNSGWQAVVHVVNTPILCSLVFYFQHVCRRKELGAFNSGGVFVSGGPARLQEDPVFHQQRQLPLRTQRFVR